MSANFGVWVAAFFTMAIYSYLYREENVLFEFAEQTFIGVSAAHFLLGGYHNVVKVALEPLLSLIHISCHRNCQRVIKPGVLVPFCQCLQRSWGDSVFSPRVLSSGGCFSSVQDKQPGIGTVSAIRTLGYAGTGWNWRSVVESVSRDCLLYTSSGIAVSSLISSIIAFLMVFFRQRVEEIVFWTMGGLSRASWKAVASAIPYAIFGVGVLWFQSRALNAFSFGEEAAFHMGVPVEKVKRRILWALSLIHI